MRPVKKIYLLMGPPGSGKGSLSKLCVKSFDWKQLSTGNLCRAHISKQTEIGKQIDFAIKSGKLVSDSLVTEMVEDWLFEILDLTSGVILDGFPRTLAQARAFSELLLDKFEGVQLKIVKLVVPDNYIITRLSARYTCKNNSCQAVYSMLPNSELNPKKPFVCDDCSTELVRRSDDEATSVSERLNIYYTHEKDLIDFFIAESHQIHELDGTQALDSIFKDFKHFVLS